MKHFSAWSFLFALALGPSGTIVAQNLVPNPSFDIQDSCPLVSEIFVAQPWNSPSFGTPDAFNSTCPTQNSAGHTGIGSSGVYVYSTFQNSREYVQAPLTAPLAAGQTYCVSFWVKRSDFRLACDRMGALLRNGAYSNNTTTNPLPFTPQVENAAGNVLGGTSWHLVSGSFTAAGGEDHIIIGNFRDDAGTISQVENASNASEVCYYKIDDVVVQACQVGIDEETSADRMTIFPQPAVDVLYISLPPDARVSRIALLDMSGRTIRTLSGSSVPPQVDVKDLPAGSYVLMVTTDRSVATQRVIIGGQ